MGLKDFAGKWYGATVLLLAAAGVLWGILYGQPYIGEWKVKWEAKMLQERLERPYRQDKYGGKTPEETFDMFLDALRKEDIDLASKYFVLNKQEQWKKTLEEYKKQNLLVDFLKEQVGVKEKWNKINQTAETIQEFSYEFELTNGAQADLEGQKLYLEAGTYKNSIIFNKNTATNIWKISVL